MKKFLSIFSLLMVAVCTVAATAFDYTAGAISLAAIPLLLDSSTARIAYERVKQLASTKNFIIAPGDIRSEIVITDSLTNYTFEVRDTILQGQSATRPLQKGVLDNDLFISFRQGLFIDNRTAGASNVVLNTYPNSAVFSAVTTDYRDLSALYNGLLSIQVGATQFINQYSTQNFYKVPQTQKSLATNDTEWSLAKAATDLGTYSIFSGKADNQVVVNIKSYTGYNPVATSGENVFTFWAQGIIIRNGADAFEDFRVRLAAQS